MVEAYASVRASLSFATDHGVPRTLMLTSTRPGEGKTTSSVALATSLSRLGRRVLLIDGDMRSPSIHGLLELTNEVGLSNILSGNMTLEGGTQAFEGLTVLAAGPQPPNAAELLAGPRMRQLLDEAIRYFDHVVIDSPPVMGLADAPLLASSVEGAVFIIQSNGTKARFARVALERLRQSHATVLGAVLTKFDQKRSGLGYGYDYGYGYGGDRQEPESRRADREPA
jgi:polysaccharide biosynthesis transport protein